jgi:hypothetical protein
MRMGFRMRLQAMAAVQAKVLRLNSAAIADVTSGKARADPLPCPCHPACGLQLHAEHRGLHSCSECL